MADEEVVPMHVDFARWYGVVSLTDDQQDRLARWAGVSSITKEAELDDVETLIRLAFQTKQPAAQAGVQKIREAFKKADDAFEMKGNDRELQVLAGACLAVLMENDEPIGAFAALTATTAGLYGARKADVPMDLLALAESAIDRIADVNRTRPALGSHTSGESPKFDFEKAVAKVRETPNFEGVAQAFTIAADEARGALKTMALRHHRAILAADTFVRVQDEELQMLWWLIGQRSVDYDCAFDAVPGDAQPLVFANELAESTEFLPGPPSVKAILSRAGLKDRKKTTIPAVVNATEPEWLRQVLGENDPSPVSAPIHFAIKRHLETGEPEAWIAGWAAATGVGGMHSLSPLMLGTLFYRERLLHRFG